MSEPVAFRVVSGAPDDTELAALVTVLLASAAHPAPRTAEVPRGLWGDPATLVRRPLDAGTVGAPGGIRL